MFLGILCPGSGKTENKSLSGRIHSDNGESYEKLNPGKRMSVSHPLSMSVSMSLTVCFVGTPQDCNFLGRSYEMLLNNPSNAKV